MAAECDHCSGYGSSWSDPGDGRCSRCGGSGLAAVITPAKMSYEDGRYQAWSDACGGGSPGPSEVKRVIAAIDAGQHDWLGEDWKRGYKDRAAMILAIRANR